MNHSDVSHLFFSFVADAITFGGQLNASGHPSIVLGNVEFWNDGEHGLAYSIPTHQWDITALQAELAQAVALAPDYRRVASAEGYDVVVNGGGFSYRVLGTVNTTVHTADRLAWRAACIDNGLMPKSRDEYAAAITRAGTRNTREEKVFESLAKKRQYRLHIWSAVENGDQADSYFWKLRGSAPQASESASNFATEAEAWRDCCLTNDLLAGFKTLGESHGFCVHRSDFKQWFWIDTQGGRAGEGLPSEAEAWLNCCLHHNITKQLTPIPPSTDDTVEPQSDINQCVP